MVGLLRELQRKRDLTCMFISHDLRVVASLASRVEAVPGFSAAEARRSPRTPSHLPIGTHRER